MGILHRPQNVTPLVYAPREYYYHRPQDVFGPGKSGDTGAPDMLFSDGFEMEFSDGEIMEFSG